MQHILLLDDLTLDHAARRNLTSKHGVANELITSLPGTILAMIRCDDTSVIDQFDAIADWLNGKIEIQNADSVIPKLHVHTNFFRVPDFSVLNPVGVAGNEPARKQGVLLGMLILAFPEVYWVFVCSRIDCENQDDRLFFAAHFWDSAEPEWFPLARAGFNNLFDVTGLRKRILNTLRTSQVVYISLREKSATAIDDEEEYAIFHAYTCYRFGFRTCSVSSARLMEQLFTANGLQSPDLVLEDLFLGFGDRREAKAPSLFVDNADLRTRDQHFPQLARSSYRRCVTAGRGYGTTNLATEQANAEYYEKLSSTGYPRWKSHTLHKPCSGVFDLWKRSKLLEQLEDEYSWSPRVSRLSGRSEHHSVRERLPSIINQLVNRAERIMRSEPTTVAMCTYGAVLANDAIELLGGRAPTTALRATSLKHEFEVMAECQFFGAAYNLDVTSRLADIKEAVDDVGQWFHPTIERHSLSNIRAGIINRLLTRYRDHIQFDEEQSCLQEIRRARHEITATGRTSLTRKLLGFFSSYTVMLLDSVERLFLVTALWGLAFWMAFGLLVWDWKWSPALDWSKVGPTMEDSLAHCFNAFLGFAVVPEWKCSVNPPVFLFINCMAVMCGIFHLGVFVAHLYSFIARK